MTAFDTIFIVVTLSLVIQLAVLVLILVGYRLVRRLKFLQHGKVMAIAVATHLAAVFFIMVPSFVAAVLPEYVLVDPGGLVSVISIIHEVTGGAALALGVWFVASWRNRKDFKGCFNRRKAMRYTITVWMAALIFGIALYVIFNWALLAG